MRAGYCSNCGKRINLYDSHWHDAETGELFCTEPDDESPSPVGPCFREGRSRVLSRHWLEFEKLLFDHGFRYYTDG